MTQRLKVTVIGYVDVPDGDLVRYDAATIEEAADNQQRKFDEERTTVSEIVALLDEVGSVKIESNLGEIEIGDKVSFMWGTETVLGRVTELRRRQVDDGVDAVVRFRIGPRSRQTTHQTIRNIDRLTRVGG